METQVRDDARARARKDRGARWRLLVIGVLFVGLYAVIGVHIYRLQTQEMHLRERAERQSTGRITLGAGGENHLDGHRGYIYDRHGYELAISVETPSIFIHPHQIEDKSSAAIALSQALQIDLEEVRQKLASNSPFVWLERKTTPEKGAAAKALHIRGVGTKRESKRYYPGQELAGQIIGFVGLDNVGLEGLESTYDQYLRGGVLRIQGVRDARGRVILTTDSPRLNALEGGSITLTLDQYIQKVTENALERAARQHDAKAAMAIVMDPRTGEILAMANWPRFNPNRFRDYHKDNMRNRTVLDAYEPGSTMKVFTYAAAIDAKRVRPGDPISQERGKLRIGSATISDTYTIPDMTAEMVVSQSSNIGAYHLAQKLGRDGFHDYLKKFGFGQRTGINIAGESAGILTEPRRWAEIQFANIAFGHGISVSPIQMAAAVSAIANDGKRMQPWLIREIRDHNGNIILQNGPVEREQVVSPATAATVRQAMERVTTEGTGMRAWVAGYRVGGKTGTAQKVDPRTRAYGNKYMGNFVGIAPIHNPDIVVVVLIDEPKRGHTGGLVAAPVFSEIVTQVLPYRGVFPESVMSGKLDPFELQALSNLPSHNPLQTRGELEETAHWNGQPICHHDIQVPDFIGLSSSAALRLATQFCLVIDLQGYGFVSSQWPERGTLATPNSRIELALQPRYQTLK